MLKKAVVFVPLGIFALLVIVLAAGFGLDDPHKLPSELVGRPLPDFRLRDVTDLQRIVSSEELRGEVTLLNVWATWCPSCLAEHKELVKIAGEGVVRLVGVNYNDDVVKAQQWLRQLGNPYWVTVADTEGSLGVNLGVYGAPETFVVDGAGTIRYRHVGPVTEELWLETLRPMVVEIRNASAGKAAKSGGPGQGE